ncbi:hypothetical protein [Nocardia sp. alder85J]|uniref:hypothetical protein n=1 Tax=Nocardia sp. alder85J TaxID=2862949 RepID=UPI001CD4698F|nr:hypothetical protein [Nocardia sp. alder85J]MCX4094669.1 hypothetical protein [Nocardia sp. alder85J]
MDNPVFHQWPGHLLTPTQMHAELNKRHADCTLERCEMKRYCWTLLIDLGHPEPTSRAADCLACRAIAA